MYSSPLLPKFHVLRIKFFQFFLPLFLFFLPLYTARTVPTFSSTLKKAQKSRLFIKKVFYPIVSNITLSMYLQTFDTHSSKSTFSNRSVIPACFRFSSQKSSESARNLLHSSAYFGSANLFFNLVISLDCCEVCAFLLSPKILHDSTVNTPQQSLRVPQSAPSIVKVPSEELSEPLLRL